VNVAEGLLLPAFCHIHEDGCRPAAGEPGAAPPGAGVSGGRRGAVGLHDLYGHAFVTGLHLAVLITLVAAALTFTATQTLPCTD